MSRILIIEDEENLANFVELELKHEGYDTDVELDGRAGLEAALNQDFDVILLDLMLPELNGIEVARRVRELKDTPIIIMTARDSVIDRVSGLDHGQMIILLSRLLLKNFLRGCGHYYGESALKMVIIKNTKQRSITRILPLKKRIGSFVVVMR